MKICPSCKVQYSGESQFCSRCGTNLVEEPGEKQETTNYWEKYTLLHKLGLLGVIIVLISVGIFFVLTKKSSKFTSHQQTSVKVLDQSYVDTLVDNYLEKDVLANERKSGAIGIGDKIYLLVVTEMRGVNRSKLYEIRNNLAIDYKIEGDLPVFRGDDDKLLIKDVTNDGIPEFIYYSSTKSNDNRSFYWTIINILKKEIAEGDYVIPSEIYGNSHISLNTVADGNESYKDYILNRVASKENEILSENNDDADKDATHKLLVDYWMHHNGMDCSKLLSPCKVQLLWISFSNESDILNVPKNAEVENSNYKVDALSKDGVYLIDKSNSKVALIYLPEDRSGQIKKVNIVGDKVVLYRETKKDGNLPVVFDIKETSLKKVKNINQDEEE
jgi:hypothetical protein